MHHNPAAGDLKLREYKHLSQLATVDVAHRDTGHVPVAAGADVILCVANFPTNTGYAWHFIETLYARLADRLAPRGVRTLVAYPAMTAPPKALRGSAASAVHLRMTLSGVRELTAIIRFVREHGVRILYLADRPAWHPTYGLLRFAGIRHIIVHDHTSGQRTIPRGIKRFLKWLTRRLMTPMLADTVIGVSDYVVRRKVEVDLIPSRRVRRVWNSVEVKPLDGTASQRLRDAFGLAAETIIVVCACRATREKGVDCLLRAFDMVAEDADVVLVYIGDGPDYQRLTRIRESLRARDRVHFGGYRSDAAALIAGADICAVPSIWEEAFGLSVLEPMACGVPVIASRVGGIPEIVIDGETGLLVPAADEDALAEALARLITEAGERQRLGSSGRRRAAELFSMDTEIEQLAALIEPALSRS